MRGIALVPEFILLFPVLHVKEYFSFNNHEGAGCNLNAKPSSIVFDSKLLPLGNGVQCMHFHRLVVHLAIGVIAVVDKMRAKEQRVAIYVFLLTIFK